MGKKKPSQAEFVRWFGPLLDALRQLGGSGKPREAADKIAENLRLHEEKLSEILSSGQSRYYNQVAWARQYLAWEGLLDTSQHGIWALSSKGETTVLNIDQSREIFLKWVDVHRKAKKDKSEKDIIQEQEESEPDDLQTGSQPVEMFKRVELGLKKKTIYEVDLPFFEPYIEKKI
jgi:restriction system protein